MSRNHEEVCIDCQEIIEHADTCETCEQSLCSSCIDLHEDACFEQSSFDEDEEAIALDDESSDEEFDEEIIETEYVENAELSE